jgi:[ribosomal protein S5]-alanine N-acetyltransferase
MTTIINIFTKRLHLREFTAADWEAVYRYRSVPAVKRYDTFGPNTVEEIHELLDRAVQWQALQPRTHYFGAVAVRTTGQLIGEFGLFFRDPHASAVAEIGYMFHQAVWGQGYATETVQALLQLGFDQIHATTIAADCSPENIAAWRVLEKVGMRRVASLDESSNGRQDTDFRYTIQLEQWSRREHLP